MANQSILIVEDEKAVADLIERYLKSSGYTVAATVTGGEEALRQAAKLRPALILMDIELAGEIDGVETAERMQNRFDIPVVFLTGLDDDATLQRSQSAGAFGYLLKPFRREELKASIEFALNKHKVESKLRSIEHWFSAAIKSIADAVITVDLEATIAFLNPVAESLSGWTRDSVIGRRLGDVFQILDEQTRRPLPSPMLPAMTEGKIAGFPPRTILIAGDGREIPIEGSAGPIRSEHGSILGGVLIFRDVTEQKRAEEQLKHSREELRSLAAHLQTVREEERKRISREIHDELGQTLTGLKMDLSWLDRRLRGLSDGAAQAPLLEKAKSMSDLLDTMVKSVRKISADLRPGVLDDLGLVPAMEWQAREWQMRSGIPCTLVCQLPEGLLDPELGTAAFRIFQETLTNVARHAKAGSVHVLLRSEMGQLILQIKDNGRGIAESEKAGLKSFGLVGMRERASILGGDFNISGLPGQGTTVTVRLPLKLAADGPARAP